MNYELFIARRLRLNPDDTRRMSPSIVIAVTGIALSLVVMMTALCIVLGFKHEIRDKVMGFDAHVTILPGTNTGDEVDDDIIDLTSGLHSVIDSTGFFKSATLAVRQPGILKTDNDYQGIIFKGMSSGEGWDFVEANIVEGSMPDYSLATSKFDVAISRTIADMMQISIGDKVNAYFFLDNGVKARPLKISAIYDTHFSDYDKLYVFGSLNAAQGLLRLSPTQGNMIELRVNDIDRIDEASQQLHDDMVMASYDRRIDGLYRINNVHYSALMYFNWLELLDTNVIVIIVLMMLVSGFTLISSLFIIILERVGMIGLLKALGSTNREVGRIFMYVAQRVVIIGMLVGNGVGLAFLLSQSTFHFLPLDPEAYYLNYVPVEINWLYLLILDVTVFLVSWGMILVPSRLVAKISPAKSMRYE